MNSSKVSKLFDSGTYLEIRIEAFNEECIDKKKYEKTNKEVIQQNIQLHAQMRLLQDQNQELAQKNLELTRKNKILEADNEELTSELTILKVDTYFYINIICL